MKKNLQSAPTLKDVALACGVSEATVSYVINGKKKMRGDTREKVFRAMREMNYHPNAVARGLSQRRVHSLGVLFGQVDPAHCINDPYMSGVLAGVMARAQQDGFTISLFTQRWENAAQSALPLRDGRTDGILALAPPLDSDMLEGLASLRVPVVVIAGEQRAGVWVVDVDSYTGTRLAAEHLIALGHRRIAYLSGAASVACFEPRRAGVCKALEDAGLEVVPELMQVSCFGGTLSREQTRTMVSLPNPPTAIIAPNDTSAMGVMEAAREMGVKIPEDLSVVGFDDVPVASLVSPPLTTIRQPLHAIGETATGLLIEQICRPGAAGPGEPLLLTPELIVRGSTAPCKR